MPATTRLTVCPGPCNRALRRAPDPGDRTPEPGNPVWCDRDGLLVARCLAELPELLAAIHLEALYGTPSPGARVRRTNSAPPWPGEAARMLTDLIVGGLLTLEDELRYLRGYSPRPDLPEGAAASRAIQVLNGSLEWLLQQHPDAADPEAAPGALILRWQYTAVRFTKADVPRTVQKDLPCPSCDLLTLTTVPGEDSVECGNCGLILRDEEYQRRVKQYAIYVAVAGR